MASRVTVPVPSTYANGVLLASELTGDVSDAVAWLMKPPLFIGLQTATAQVIANATDTTVQIDTELVDTVSGHLLTNATVNPTYYGMQPGWYLVEAAAPLNYTGGAGYFTVGIGGQSNGTPISIQYGQLTENPSGQGVTANATHLMRMVNTGTYGGANNDFIQMYCSQNTTASQNLFNGSGGPGRAPYISARWVATFAPPNGSGVANLTVPANPAWPVPPSYLLPAFMNANIRDAINFLVYPPMLYAYFNGSANIASSANVPPTGTTINLGQVIIDNYTAYNGTTWTAPVSGIYYCYGQLGAQSRTSSVAIGCGLTVNSANYGGSTLTLWGDVMTSYNVATTDRQCAIVRKKLRLNAGDTLQLAGWQNDSSGNPVSVNTNASLWATKMLILWTSA